MQPMSEYTSKGRGVWVVGAMVGGAMLCGAVMFCHRTSTAPAPRKNLTTASAETARAVTKEPVADSTPAPGAPATAVLPQAKVEVAPSALPVNAPVTAAHDATQVEPQGEDHPERRKELDQTPAWKSEKTRAILRVVASRAERVEKEATELEQTGDNLGAASQRVLLARLKRQIATMNDEIVAYSKADSAETR